MDKEQVILEATKKLADRLQEIGGCTDGNCVVWKPTGMHTNGGCRCLNNQFKAQRVVSAYRNFRVNINGL